jgi:hypothetical protein
MAQSRVRESEYIRTIAVIAESEPTVEPKMRLGLALRIAVRPLKPALFDPQPRPRERLH